jgi:FAD/FMN-containing dehydrogenase
MAQENNFQQLKTMLRGELIEPTDANYNLARKVYNGMIDKKPAAIARCNDVADVIACVNFARENKILLAVRGGGHNGGGLGVCDNGLVIALSGIRYAHVDPVAKTVRVGGGSTWADVDHATHAFGLAVPSGIISSTGVGGLTLGGGLGHLTRNCGLTIDNLLEADVVLADGTCVTASEKNNEDLFWALRGGGGNFGVVTSFLFRLHNVHTLYGGPMLWDIDESERIMKWYRDYIKTAPDELTGFFAFLTVPPGPPFPENLHNKKMCGVVWSYSGPLDKAEKVFEPIRNLGNIALDFCGPIPHPALQSMFDALYQPGYQWYWRADYVNELSDEAIKVHIKHGREMPNFFSTMHLYPVNGAAGRVRNDETAWSYRDATWAEVIVGVDPDPANKDIITKWCKDYWEATHPYSAGGAYINFMMDEGQDRIRATYKDNYDRLAMIKAKYDPNNLFRVNQNIKPAVMTEAAGHA